MKTNRAALSFLLHASKRPSDIEKYRRLGKRANVRVRPFDLNVPNYTWVDLNKQHMCIRGGRGYLAKRRYLRLQVGCILHGTLFNDRWRGVPRPVLLSYRQPRQGTPKPWSAGRGGEWRSDHIAIRKWRSLALEGAHKKVSVLEWGARIILCLPAASALNIIRTSLLLRAMPRLESLAAMFRHESLANTLFNHRRCRRRFCRADHFPLVEGIGCLP